MLATIFESNKLPVKDIMFAFYNEQTDTYRPMGDNYPTVGDFLEDYEVKSIFHSIQYFEESQTLVIVFLDETEDLFKPLKLRNKNASNYNR